MAFPSYQNTYYPQPGYQNTYYSLPQPDQLAQLRQNQMLPNIPPPQPVPANPSGTPQSGGMIWVRGRRLSCRTEQRPGALGPEQPGDLFALCGQHRKAVHKGL